MGWAHGFVAGRDVGYGVEATCDKRGCENVIDRGLGYVCGDFPHYWFDDQPGCGMFYCGEHDTGVGPRGGCGHRQRKPWGRVL